LEAFISLLAAATGRFIFVSFVVVVRSILNATKQTNATKIPGDGESVALELVSGDRRRLLKDITITGKQECRKSCNGIGALWSNVGESCRIRGILSFARQSRMLHDTGFSG
jgi:hypothetical protein